MPFLSPLFIFKGIGMEEEKARLEAKVRREMMQLFLEEAKIEAEAKEQHDRLMKDREDEMSIRSAMSLPTPGNRKRQDQAYEGLEMDVGAMKARMRLEERIKLEKLRGKRIFQGALISSAVVAIAVSVLVSQQKEPVVYYDLGAVKAALQKAVSYYAQFEVEDVVLSKDTPSATLNLSFKPSTEKDLKEFVEKLIKKYSMLRPGEKINLVLKAQRRIYAAVSYIPRSNSIEIELMK